MKQIKIFGFGEIGKSIYEVYSKAGIVNVSWKDIDKAEGLTKCDVLNVCIPFSNGFVDVVITEILLAEPKMVIIHSTVAPGTTRKIATKFPNIIVVHSPVIGVHPNLAQGILTFRKYVSVASEKDDSYKEVFKHFSIMGIHNRGVVAPYEATELMKMLDTTYYGMTIAFNMEARKLLEEHGCKYDNWVNYNKQYNDGYKKLGMSHVVRPTYENLTEKIGGHCVGNNARIFKKIGKFLDPSKFVLKWSK